MQDKPVRGTNLTFRLTSELSDDLKRIAQQEANTQSAVVRRLLRAGLARERRAEPDLAVRTLEHESERSTRAERDHSTIAVAHPPMS